MGEKSGTGSGIDEAALLGVALAATVSISVAEGEWELLDTIVGVAMLFVVSSYYQFSTARERSNRRLVRCPVCSP